MTDLSNKTLRLLNFPKFSSYADELRFKYNLLEEKENNIILTDEQLKAACNKLEQYGYNVYISEKHYIQFDNCNGQNIYFSTNEFNK